jgi:hypothetical protein
MENEIANVESQPPYNFTVINGSHVRVGHCINCDSCRIPVCVGTDCKNYQPKH